MESVNQRPRVRIWGCMMITALVLAVFSGSQVHAAYEDKAPRFEATYAAKSLSPGDVWEIYVKGSDPDGDLRFIHAWIYIPGMPTTPVRLMVDANQGHAVSGHLFLHSMEFGGDLSNLFGIPFALSVTLEDRSGHRSETVELPFAFYYGAKQAPPPAGVFEDRFLGRIPGLFFLPNGAGS